MITDIQYSEKFEVNTEYTAGLRFLWTIYYHQLTTLEYDVWAMKRVAVNEQVKIEISHL